MTVNGIWEWANHVSQKVPLESLRRKTLSIDGQIWLYENINGCADHFQQVPNTYLVTFYNRILHLMTYQITPIVVFDNVNSQSSAPDTSDQSHFVPRKRFNYGVNPFVNTVDCILKLNVLLENLGVKVIFAPGDGEAQCAKLEEMGVTSGCITSDFDYFLFGGKNLYRFTFGSTTMKSAQFKEATHLSLGRMNIERKLSRPHLITTAILLGCDYYQHGVQNAGLVTVFEILAEFGDEGSEEIDPHVILDRFSSYVREEIPARSEDSPRKLRLRRKKYKFMEGFPNCDAVHNAIKMYKNPSVSNEIPDMKRPRPICQSKVEKILEKECGWNGDRNVHNDIAKSEKHDKNMTQTRILEFYGITRTNKTNMIVEPCSSLDEYISAQKTWVRKRKRDGEPDSSETRKKRSPRIPPKPSRAFEPNPDDVITLDSD